MVTQELTAYIKQRQLTGSSRESINAELLQSNWSQSDIDQAFAMAQSAPVPPLQPTPAQTTQPQSSNQTHVIITIVLLFFAYPIGLICMWALMKKWPLWLKIILSLPLLILPVLIFIGILLIGINPTKQFAQANDTKRESDVEEIINAISQYEADNSGKLPVVISHANEEIASGPGNADLCSALVPEYIASLPIDPLSPNADQEITSCSVSYDTGYTISVDAMQHITIKAPKAELNKNVSVTR